MRNLMSHNQLEGWRSNVTQIEETTDYQNQLLNDYFNCLIECEDDQSSCKTICKDILM